MKHFTFCFSSTQWAAARNHKSALDIEFRHYTTISRLLYDLDEAAVKQVETELEAIIRPYLLQGVNEVLRHQEY